MAIAPIQYDVDHTTFTGYLAVAYCFVNVRASQTASGVSVGPGDSSRQKLNNAVLLIGLSSGEVACVSGSHSSGISRNESASTASMSSLCTHSWMEVRVPDTREQCTRPTLRAEQTSSKLN